MPTFRLHRALARAAGLPFDRTSRRLLWLRESRLVLLSPGEWGRRSHHETTLRGKEPALRPPCRLSLERLPGRTLRCWPVD